jgi:hypothetical protein
MDLDEWPAFRWFLLNVSSRVRQKSNCGLGGSFASECKYRYIPDVAARLYIPSVFTSLFSGFHSQLQHYDQENA